MRTSGGEELWEGELMAMGKVTSKGQVTIPVEVRRALGLSTGSRVEFVPTDTGSYELVPRTGTIRALKGAIGAPAKAVTLAEMEEAVSDGAAESLRQ